MFKNWSMWIGRVIDNEDPDKRGRLKVRVMGVHSFNPPIPSDEDLPWANVVMPPVFGGVSGRGTCPPPQMLPNSNVFGVALDGQMMQQLFVLGIMVNEAVIDPMAINPFGLGGYGGAGGSGDTAAWDGEVPTDIAYKPGTCPVGSKYDEIIEEMGKKHNVDPNFVRAIIFAESKGDPSAVSYKGARGIMQLMPGTAREMGVKDSSDPRQNIDGGTRYIAIQLSKFQNPIAALAAYNAGPQRPINWNMGPHTTAADAARIPIKETRNYVSIVMGRYQEYSAKNCGPAAAEAATPAPGSPAPAAPAPVVIPPRH
jgi:hypothetical protein